jgi:hypothetical protein
VARQGWTPGKHDRLIAAPSIPEYRLLLSSSIAKSATWDESIHLAAGYAA